MFAIVAYAGLEAPAFPLTVDSIMRGPAMLGRPPRTLRWSDDGEWLSFSWGKADGSQQPPMKNFRVRKDGTGLVEGPAFPPAIPTLPTPPSQPEARVLITDGDITYQAAGSSDQRRLTNTPETESDPRLVENGSAVLYIISGNLYRLTVSDSARTQLTDVKPEAEATAPQVPNGPTLIKIPTGYQARTWRFSPRSDRAWLSFTEEVPSARRADVPNYVTMSGYPEMIATFARVGAPQAQSKGLFFNPSTRAVTPIATPRAGSVTEPRWSPDGSFALVFSRANDYKDDWVYGYNSRTDSPSTVWNEHSDGWVGGPGRGTMGWLPDGSRLYFISERSGFANLYTMPATGGEPTPLVAGKFEVSDVRLDAARSRFTFVSSAPGPAERILETIKFDGSGRRKLAQLSPDEDMTYAIAPDGEKVAVVRSKPNRPGELFVNDVQVTTTPTEEWLSYKWIEPPIVQVPSSDGVSVASRLYKPKGWKRGGPAVIFVHGAGYLQNIFNGWSRYYREYMFHHILMEKGYMVLDMDFRASAGYGQYWRTAISGHMGQKDLEDHLAGAKYLVDQHGAARDRLGIYGGSYGGFITLMAMFKTPGVFAAGAALRPVTDWTTYNHGYTAPILGTPQTNSEAFRRSSPIHFAEGLRGSLLICHGMVDVNVPFQDSVRLSQRLIELGKENWEIAPYPVEDHAFTRPASWADEYKRILALFERTIGSKRPAR